MKYNGHTNGHGPHGAGSFIASKDALDPRVLVSGKRIVLLGGTGFLGKIFASLLLYRFPELGRVYMLVRKGSAAIERSALLRDHRDERAVAAAARPVRGRVREVPSREDRPRSTATSGSRSAESTATLIDELRGTDRGRRQRRGRRRLQSAARRSARRERVRRAEPRRARQGARRRRADAHEHVLRGGLPQRPDPRGGSVRSSVPALRGARTTSSGIRIANRRLPRPDRASEAPLRRRISPERVSREREENLLSRGEPTRGRRARRGAREGAPQVRRRQASSKPASSARCTGAGPTRTRTRRASASRSSRGAASAHHDRAPRVLRDDHRASRSRLERGHLDVGAVHLPRDEGTDAPAGRLATRPRLHPDATWSRRDDPRARRAPRGNASAALPIRRERHEPVHAGALRRAHRPLQAEAATRRRAATRSSTSSKRTSSPRSSEDTIEKIGAPASRARHATLVDGAEDAPVPMAQPAAQSARRLAKDRRRSPTSSASSRRSRANTLGPFACANARAAYARLPAEYKRSLQWTPGDDRLGRLLRRHPHARAREVDPSRDGEAHGARAEGARARTRRSRRSSTKWRTATRTPSRSSSRAAETDGLFSRITFDDVRARRNAVAARSREHGRQARAIASCSPRRTTRTGRSRISESCARARRPCRSIRRSTPRRIANIVRESGAKVALFDAHVREKQIDASTVIDLHDDRREATRRAARGRRRGERSSRASSSRAARRANRRA